MNAQTLPRDLRLQSKAIHSLPDATDVELTCREGTLWVTVDNDSHDYILEAGDTFTAQEHGRAVVYAMEPSRMSLARVTRPARNSRKLTMPTFSKFHAMPFMKAAR